MFTGIVQGMAQVVDIAENADLSLRRLTIKLPPELSSNIMVGCSIANNGCCLTVVAIDREHISFDVIQETLKLTNIGLIQIGDYVNVERAAKFGDEIGGHLMSGHISCTTAIKKITHTPDNCSMIIALPEALRDYVLYKGFIGIDGASLTVGEVKHDSFYLHLIPETLNSTTLQYRKVGDLVNIELDPQTQAIVDTVKKYLSK